MPVNTELLNPIAGSNPGGTNLRYDPIYDRIKEARREDEAIPQGDWQRELKKADWPLVIKLCGEALSTKTKDLQLAAWMTEALVRREGFAGLQDGLELLRGLIDQFWDCLYPEPEDGDMEMRTVPLDWIGSRIGESLKKVPLAKGGFDWFKYKESRSVGYEADLGDSDAKREAREQAVADGKLTAEEFDKAFDATPKNFYLQKAAEIGGCMEATDSLAQIGETKFGDFAPSFSNLRESLEAILQTVNSLLARKRETEPDETPTSSEPPVEEVASTDVEETPVPPAVPVSGAGAAPARAPIKKVVTAEPANREDAYERVSALAAWLRKEDPYNPVPYVLVRSMRWGELRAAGSDIDPTLLAAPSTDVRMRIKGLFNDGNYDELFPLMEEAAAQPCGRGWLDLQRYFCSACDSAGGYDYVKNAVITELKALLCDYPNLPNLMLVDDTPAANAETRAWLEPLLGSATEASSKQPMEELYSAPPSLDDGAADAGAEAQPPDVFELAKQGVQSGHAEEGIGLLARAAVQENSGRGRFQRRVQLAQICVAAGHEAIAYPILEGLAEEIETRKLEGWEAPDVLAHALSLFFRCAHKLKQDSDLKQVLYARICRLDPVQALELMR